MYLLTKFSIVKQHLRKTKKGLVTVREYDNKKILKNILLGTGLVASTAIVGNKILKNKLRKTMSTTLNLAKKEADNIKLNIPPNAKAVSFVVEGNQALDDIATNFADQAKRVLNNNHVINIDNKAYRYKDAVGAIKADFDTIPKAINKGHDEVATNLLANIFALRRDNPNLKINLIGHSYGNLATHQVSEHLNKLGIEHKVASIGSATSGMFKNKENIRIQSLSDPYTYGLDSKATVRLGKVLHPDYHKSSVVDNLLKKHLDN